uniref:Uncharacterized protein n=1 Tax=Arundo donax TaxID=35708 RepID=A0A0A9AJ61_ARUDO
MRAVLDLMAVLLVVDAFHVRVNLGSVRYLLNYFIWD